MPKKQYFQNIVNFEKCIQFKELHHKMGVVNIQKLPDIKFERMVKETVEHIDVLPEELEIERHLISGEIDLQFDEISVQSDFLFYKGRKVAAYIRDQPHHSIVSYGVDPDQKVSGYKYHLCNCKTLQDMTVEGRERRYFVSKRQDGFFNVNCILKAETQKLSVAMDLCGYCKKMLSGMKISLYKFSLERFFKEHDTYIPKSISRCETYSRIQDYSDDHKAVSAMCKKAVDYTCQKCGVKSQENRSLLHLHHINGDKSNNYPSNLQVFCVECHSKEFMHEHMIDKFQRQISSISEMRQKQGILDLNNK